MKFALIGYGKMGHEIEAAGLERGHSFPLIIDISNQEDLNKENLRKVDVAIDFSHPDAITGHIYTCFEAGIPVVAGTTGWHQKREEVFSACRQMDGSIFHASNFSIGVNILFSLNRYLAGIMKHFSNYSVAIREVHHTQKIDAPSGTAISLAEQLISELPDIQNWKLAGQAGKGDLPIEAIREGDVKGDHTITFDSDIDTLFIGHHAKSRKGFAIGAVLAAEFLFGKKGVFSMEDMLRLES